MNTRDQQIAAVNEAVEDLRPDRLESCRAKILESYKETSVIDKMALVREITDREPSDFALLTSQEARLVEHFNDDSYHWDFYCEQLGRAIALGEEAHLLSRLGSESGDGDEIDAEEPNFEPIITGVQQLRDRGYRPALLIAPISLYMPVFKKLQIDWSDGRVIVLPDQTRIELIWSSKAAPIDRFVVLDPRAVEWKIKLDPQTGERLTVAIGCELAPPGAVTFLAETVAKYDIVKREAMYVVEVVGEPPNDFGPEESTRQEGEPANG